MKETIFPIQPIADGRFVENRIVSAVLEASTLDLNQIAMMDFTDEERMQFAQLIGYSLSGFGSLSYASDEVCAVAHRMSEEVNEDKARNEALREMLDETRKGVKQAAAALFSIHPDDLST